MKNKEIIVLIGLSGCGKTTLGRKIAEKLGYDFLDTDETITSKYGDIQKLFDISEEHFRKCESKVIKNIKINNKTIVSTGGGIILKKENMDKLAQNLVIYIKRDIYKIIGTEDRPLLKEYSLEELYNARRKLYEKYADIVFENNFDDISAAVKKLLEVIYENTDNQRC